MSAAWKKSVEPASLMLLQNLSAEFKFEELHISLVHFSSNSVIHHQESKAVEEQTGAVPS